MVLHFALETYVCIVLHFALVGPAGFGKSNRTQRWGPHPHLPKGHRHPIGWQLRLCVCVCFILFFSFFPQLSELGSLFK